MKRQLFGHGGDSSGAVAATVGLSLFALVAAGGIAFDYARLASMDTELQNAADQAALAAASQLTGDPGACSRAAAAAANMLSNLTVMANDTGTQQVTIANEPACDAIGNIRFYQDKAKTTPATSDADAEFVEVQVNPRTAFYALTPVVAAFSSGPVTAVAFAGLGESYCKVPPVMICNPQETATNLNFDFTGLNGVGLRLVSVGSGSGGWAPGNFGYLDMPGLSSGAPGLREGLGWGVPPTDCIEESGLDTKPGATVDVTDSINTRFDIYDGTACPTGGTCPASINSVKDVKRPFDATGGNACRMHNSGWQLPTGAYGSGSNEPHTALTPLPDTTTPTAMGHPRDMCHAVEIGDPGACTQIGANGNIEWNPIGNGEWDRDAYFRTNYGWDHATWVANVQIGGNPITTSTPRRYDVYMWEIANRGTTIGGRTILGQNPASATGSDLVSQGQPVCSGPQGYGSGQVPNLTTADRRLITVAIVNCLQQSVNGNSTNVQTVGWLDAFLVEPSLARGRTTRGDVYVEVVGSSTTGVQVVSKKVPYLIE